MSKKTLFMSVDIFMVNLDQLTRCELTPCILLEWKMEAGDSDLALGSDDKHACTSLSLSLLLADCMVSSGRPEELSGSDIRKRLEMGEGLSIYSVW